MAQSAISSHNLYPVPTPKPGHRFVPAKVGPSNASSVIVLIECPTWCTEDHVDEPVRNIEDVMHRGQTANVLVPTFGFGTFPVQMHSWVEADPAAVNDPYFRAAHIAVQDACGNDVSNLTPEMAETLADEIIGFASELRQQARTARQANQAVGDSDPDMAKALRQLRGEAV